MKNKRTPIEIARELYKKKGWDFDEAVKYHLSAPYGGVICFPTALMIGRATLLENGQPAWYIDCAVGNLKQIIQWIPFKLPFVCFERRKTPGKLNIWPLERLQKLAA